MAIFDVFRKNKDEINPSAEVMQDVQNIDQEEVLKLQDLIEKMNVLVQLLLIQHKIQFMTFWPHLCHLKNLKD